MKNFSEYPVGVSITLDVENNALGNRRRNSVGSDAQIGADVEPGDAGKSKDLTVKSVGYKKK